VVPISTREPKRTVNQSVATSHKKTVATESTVKKPRSIIRKLYEQLIEIILFIVDAGCSKHMTGNLKLLRNITIKRVYYVEWLNHNLFFVGQFYDANLEVAFWKSTCYIRDLKGNDLLTGSRGTDMYSITLQDTSTPNPICLMAKATSSQAWLWHHRLSHLNFDTINLLSKYDIVTGPSQIEICQRSSLFFLYTWTHFLRSKDETPEVLIDFLKLVQRGLHAQVRIVRTDKGTKFLNKTLYAYFAQEGIEHQTSVARTPEQNGFVERWNHTLVEAVRTMLSAAKVPLYFWAKAIATTCFTQNRSLVIPRHEKTPYHIINGRKPSVKFFHIFGSLYYIVIDGENLDKMKEKGDACIFVGYSTQLRAYRFKSRSPKSRNVPQAVETVTTSNELDLLFSLMFDELLNGTTQVVSKSSAVTTADVPNQQTNKEYAQVKEDEFINIFSTPVQERGETSFCHFDSSNMHTFYQHSSEHRWTKDHPLEKVIGHPSQSVRTRCRLEIDGEMYSDHASCLDSRKSTSGGIQFLSGDKLVSWSSKKQECISMSLAEAKTEYQLADLFTKALLEDRFKYLVRRLGMRCLTPEELEVLANESA
ncbi:integrase, catalytic region, zinc finger, CCHC-type containing protein, partial [Tanacetum coccineum]